MKKSGEAKRAKVEKSPSQYSPSPPLSFSPSSSSPEQQLVVRDIEPTTPSSGKPLGIEWCRKGTGGKCEGPSYRVTVEKDSSDDRPPQEDASFEREFINSLKEPEKNNYGKKIEALNKYINSDSGMDWGIRNDGGDWQPIIGLIAGSIMKEYIRFPLNLQNRQVKIAIGKDLLVPWKDIIKNPDKRGGRKRRKSRKSLFKKKRTKKRTKKRKRRRRRKSKRKSPKRRKKTRRRRK